MHGPNAAGRPCASSAAMSWRPLQQHGPPFGARPRRPCRRPPERPQRAARLVRRWHCALQRLPAARQAPRAIPARLTSGWRVRRARSASRPPTGVAADAVRHYLYTDPHPLADRAGTVRVGSESVEGHTGRGAKRPIERTPKVDRRGSVQGCARCRRPRSHARARSHAHRLPSGSSFGGDISGFCDRKRCVGETVERVSMTRSTMTEGGEAVAHRHGGRHHRHLIVFCVCVCV